MERAGHFANFDDDAVYNQSQTRALDDSTLNFAVEFGKEKACIAFDLCLGDVQDLLNAQRQPETPIRWINIWGPNNQADLVNLLGEHYKFSPRLLAVIQTAPPPKPSTQARSNPKYQTKPSQKDDVELATASLDTPRTESSSEGPHNTSHYTIAKQMLNYHSNDIGPRFLCLGANWMHEVSTPRSDVSIVAEGKQRPLWSWLVLCDDNTVISFHEDTGPVPRDDLKSMRNNTLSVMSQLSKHGHLKADPISMQSVRQSLESDTSQADPGVEGASNLFYYLFDDWRAVYSTIGAFRHRLEKLQKEILEDMTRKSHKLPNIEIIPRLHILGQQIRQMQHLYEGYKNLTHKILESKAATGYNGAATPRSFSGLTSASRGVVLALSATTRFERLGDRLQLLILSQTKEFLVEKDALISTYFNINAQKDSEATGRLTRAATLLAKLSVLFLPVSLMTSYFSVQIPDLAGKYSEKDYWYTFAVILSISFLGLFFFSRLLMYITETLDAWVKHASKAFTRMTMKALLGMIFRKRAVHAEVARHE